MHLRRARRLYKSFEVTWCLRGLRAKLSARFLTISHGNIPMLIELIKAHPEIVTKTSITSNHLVSRSKTQPSLPCEGKNCVFRIQDDTLHDLNVAANLCHLTLTDRLADAEVNSIV